MQTTAHNALASLPQLPSQTTALDACSGTLRSIPNPCGNLLASLETLVLLDPHGIVVPLLLDQLPLPPGLGDLPVLDHQNQVKDGEIAEAGRQRRSPRP